MGYRSQQCAEGLRNNRCVAEDEECRGEPKAMIDRLIERLRDTNEQIGMLDENLRQDPDNLALAISLSSLRSMEEQLREEFDRVAIEERVSVCRYRLFKDEDGSFPVTSLADPLSGFQRLFSVVYDALLHGKKQRSTISHEIQQSTTLDFGYAYTGSLGVVLTMPKAQALYDEEQLDTAMRTVLEMARSTSSDQVHDYAEAHGTAVVRSLYQWAESHAAHGVGADIRWREPEGEPQNLFVQLPEWNELKRVILEVSDEEEHTEQLLGELIGANIKTHSFAFEAEDGSIISGRMSEEIGVQYTIELPKRYTALIKTTSKLNYATDEVVLKHFLVSLE